MKASGPVRALFAAALVSCPSAYAAEEPSATEAQPAAEDSSEFNELLTVMSEETEIATRTKMNSDFVPGIVSVQSGDQLSAWGARTVGDALGFIPGVQPTIDPRGNQSVIVRGIPFPFNNGNIQIMLNGVPLSRDSAGINGGALSIPIAQVERLEFVRGPGSVVYGEFAFMGLLNIITRSDGSAVGIEADSRNGLGAHAHTSQRIGDWQINANASDYGSDEALMATGRPTEESRRLGVLTIKHGSFGANLQGFRKLMRDLAPLAAPDTASEDDTLSADIGFDGAVSDDTDLQWRTQYLSHNFRNSGDTFEGDQLRTTVNVVWRGLDRHALLAGLDYSDGDFDRAEHITPPPPPPPPPAIPPPPPPPVVIGPHDRQVFGVVLQDQIELGARTQMTVGARWDDNSEIGHRVTSRASIAWQAAEHHVLKAQYAEGYRSPTFFELYSDVVPPVLDFEVNQTTEINYIFQKPDVTGRITLFRTELEDMIYRVTPPAVPPPGYFANVAAADSHGIEAEWSQQATSWLRVDVNATFMDNEDTRNASRSSRNVVTAASWLANFALLWTPQEDTLLGLHVNHIGPRAGASSGSGEYDILDLTATRNNLVVPGLDLRVGISNALDERTQQVQQSPMGISSFTFTSYRTVWAGITWRFD